jgi:predicted nucleotide-binding protein (sugar kinase/HSP70/actin superfamily)
MLFQQSGGLNQAEAEAGLEMNLDFFLGILNALNMGDLINECVYLIRPYEVNPGETDQVLEDVMDFMHGLMRRKEPWQADGSLGSLVARLGLESAASYLGKFLEQLFDNEYLGALEEVRDRLNQIKVDRSRCKPIVKVTGEFWAQTTEGDGNFNMFRFLEREGAQLIVEPIGTWIMYMIHQAIQQNHDRRGLPAGKRMPKPWDLKEQWLLQKNYYRKLALLKTDEKIFKREYNRVKEALGGIAHGLTDQYELQRVGHPYYNSRAAGGEGHLEVAKNIYYTNKELAHMVLSLKPFGCMPSTQSDGAQSAVVAHYKDMIYLPIETSGEGEVNAHSRVQMALGEARAKAKLEFAECLKQTGLSLQQIQEYVAEHEELQRPMYHVPKRKGVIGLGANFVLDVADRMRGIRRNARGSGSH